MIANTLSYAANGRSGPYFWPFTISIAVHLILMVAVIWTPTWDSDSSYLPQVIDVQMVDLTDLGQAPARLLGKLPGLLEAGLCQTDQS